MLHFIGIKGTGMSSLAQIMKNLGYEVQGSDVEKHFFTEAGLIKMGIPVLVYNKENIKPGMEIVQGNAIRDDHEEVIRAKELGLKIYTYQEMVGKLSEDFITIGISGCHGKTTTTSMLAHVLDAMIGCNYLIGDGTGSAKKENKYFALESCEYKRHFLAYDPSYVVITNIELDHVDYYKDIDDVISAYQSFAKKAKKTVLAWGEDPYTHDLKGLEHILFYGLEDHNDIVAKNITYKESGTDFDCYIFGELMGHFYLPFYGQHMVLNALAVIGICFLEKFSLDKVGEVLQTYPGAKRRFAEKWVGDSVIIDDYAHHPTEMKVCINACRQKYPRKKVICIMQPHTFSRTKKFADEFAEVLNTADYAFVMDVHPSREKASEIPGVTKDLIIQKLSHGEGIAMDEAKKLSAFSGNVFLFMSPNDITKLEHDLEGLLKRKLMFQNKKIFVFGMARSGYEVAKLLSHYNNEIIIVDAKEQDSFHVQELENKGVRFYQSEHPQEYFDDSFDYLIKNPGVPIHHPLVLMAEEKNIPVLNEVEVASYFLSEDVTIIGVTGSNGKTTTTTLIYEILKAAKLPVVLGGNIGYPVCSLVSQVKPKDIVLLEISSHQLVNLNHFKTHISVLTNIAPNHLDFFDSYEHYKQNKTKIFQNHTNEDVAIINGEDEEVLLLTQTIPSQKRVFAINSGDCYLKNDAIYYQNEKVISFDDLILKGKHNYENCMAAILVAKEFSVSNEIIFQALSQFKGVEHRLEFVDTILGVSFYNDSKATNVVSTQIAVRSFTTPLILLLGGLDRGHSFDDLKPDLKYVKQIVCFGETKSRIMECAEKWNIPCKEVDTLMDATNFAFSCAKEGDTILLSPACASWDQYACFEDRGKEFKEVIQTIKKEKAS